MKCVTDIANERACYRAWESSGGRVRSVEKHQHAWLLQATIFSFIFFFLFSISLQTSEQTTCIVSFLRATISNRKKYSLACDLTLFPASLLACVWLWNVVCRSDKIVSDSSYWHVGWRLVSDSYWKHDKSISGYSVGLEALGYINSSFTDWQQNCLFNYWFKSVEHHWNRLGQNLESVRFNIRYSSFTQNFHKQLQTLGSTIVGCGQTRTGRTLWGLIWIWPFRAIHFSIGNTRYSFNTIYWWFEIHIKTFTFLRMYVQYSCILSAPVDLFLSLVLHLVSPIYLCCMSF